MTLQVFQGSVPKAALPSIRLIRTTYEQGYEVIASLRDGNATSQDVLSFEKQAALGLKTDKVVFEFGSQAEFIDVFGDSPQITRIQTFQPASGEPMPRVIYGACIVSDGQPEPVFSVVGPDGKSIFNYWSDETCQRFAAVMYPQEDV